MTLRLENLMPIQDAKRPARAAGGRAVSVAQRPLKRAANASFAWPRRFS